MKGNIIPKKSLKKLVVLLGGVLMLSIVYADSPITLEYCALQGREAMPYWDSPDIWFGYKGPRFIEGRWVYYGEYWCYDAGPPVAIGNPF
jgi:hypothetical protein